MSTGSSDGQFPDPFVWPADLDAMIWRYMTFERFASMLEDKALYFSSVDQFDDRHEGSMTEIEKIEFARVYDEDVLAAARYLTVNYSRRRVMANCWHMSNHESATMWKLYAGTEKAIAVQSTFKRLKDALSGVARGVGMIAYVDHKTGRTHTHPFWGPYLHKRSWYCDEREVRAIVYGPVPETTSTGKLVSIDLHRLITGVVVRKEPMSLRSRVEELCLKSSIDVPIRLSEIDSEPMF